MDFPVIVDVTLREGIADPEGATIERALPALGFTGVTQRARRAPFRFDVEAEDEAAALVTATALAERLLSNPVIEDASVRGGLRDPHRRRRLPRLQLRVRRRRGRERARR